MERIKKNQEKPEEAIAPLVIEVLRLGRLRFVKAETHEKTGKQHSMLPIINRSSQRDDIQQENRRAEEEAADGSLGITSDGIADGVGKDVEQVQMQTNCLKMIEEKVKSYEKASGRKLFDL